jgi:hypothetical protein
MQVYSGGVVAFSNCFLRFEKISTTAMANCLDDEFSSITIRHSTAAAGKSELVLSSAALGLEFFKPLPFRRAWRIYRKGRRESRGPVGPFPVLWRLYPCCMFELATGLVYTLQPIFPNIPVDIGIIVVHTISCNN